MRRAVRLLGTLLIAAGVLPPLWGGVVWRWQDPFTALYTHVEQSRLSHSYDRRVKSFSPSLGGRDRSSQKLRIAAEARQYAATLHRGDPVGRLRIGRLGLNIVVVQGTDHSS